MEDFRIEVNVAEVARTVFIFAMASFADIGPAHRSEARIVQASPDGLSVHCDLHTIHAILLTVLPLRYRVLNHFFRRENAEVNLADRAKRRYSSV